jgi:transposase
MTTRRRFTGEFKAEVALEALRGDKTIQEIAVRHKVHSDDGTRGRSMADERVLRKTGRPGRTSDAASASTFRGGAGRDAHSPPPGVAPDETSACSTSPTSARTVAGGIRCSNNRMLQNCSIEVFMSSMTDASLDEDTWSRN